MNGCPVCHSRVSRENDEGFEYHWCETCNWSDYDERWAEHEAGNNSGKLPFPGKMPRNTCTMKIRRDIIKLPVTAHSSP